MLVKSFILTHIKTMSSDTKTCKYGAKCYRKNADHIKQFHPDKLKTQLMDLMKEILVLSESKKCSFGSSCYMTNPEHLKNYKHPKGHKPQPKPCKKCGDKRLWQQDNSLAETVPFCLNCKERQL